MEGGSGEDAAAGLESAAGGGSAVERALLLGKARAQECPSGCWSLRDVIFAAFLGFMLVMLCASVYWYRRMRFTLSKAYERRGHAKIMLPTSLCVQLFVVAGIVEGVLMRLGFVHHLPVVAALGLMLIFLPYFALPSRYRSDTALRCRWTSEDSYRHIFDELILTNVSYAGGTITAFLCGEYWLTAMAAFTCVGSTLYHVYRESMFFNLDNTFATALLWANLWGMICAYFDERSHFFVYLCGLPFAGFLIIYCGMPAEVRWQESAGEHIRVGNAHYNFWHSWWHVVSGIGCILTPLYFYRQHPDLELGGPEFEQIPGLPVVPTICILLGLAVNIVGNVAGIMPLD